MSVGTQIIDWSKSQPLWRQDALRRLMAGPLAAQDETELFVLLKAAYGLVDTSLTPIPLSAADDEGAAKGAQRVGLARICDVKNANRLAPDQTLSFSLSGVTLVYGDNGSGKSGYARILKRACSARDTGEPILNDVFAKAPVTAATANIEYVEGNGTPSTYNWTDGGPPSPALRRISVFDSKSAAVYVDEENQATFVPFGLDCFERLARLCDRLKDKLMLELRALEALAATPVVATVEGTAAFGFLQALGSKTDAELNAATLWSDTERDRLAEIAPLVTDADKRAVALKTLQSTVEGWCNLAIRMAVTLSDVEVVALRTLKSDLEAANQAVVVAANAFKNEPLPGVGSTSWRTLFDAARAFSEKEAYRDKPFPVDEESAKCVLCQQPIRPDGGERLRRFDKFVRDEVSRRADEVRMKWASAVEKFRTDTASLGLFPEDIARQLEVEAEALHGLLPKFFTLAVARQAAILQGVIGDEPSSLGAEPTIDVAILTSAVAQLKKRYADADAATKADGAKALRKEFEELTSKKALCKNKEQVKKRVEELRQGKKVRAAIKGCATTGISAKGTELLKEHVTSAFEKALTGERKALGIGQIPLTLFSRSPKGVASHKLRLQATTYTGNTSAVLSEGEHRSVALAAFFAELDMVGGADSIVIDDPVSSLDHQRRHDVARRLIEEAKKRQVIVFTHDLLFYVDMAGLAAAAQVPITRVAVQRGAKGFGTVDPDGDPWGAKTLGRRKAWLDQQLAKLKKVHADGEKDEYEKEAQYFYIRLRETWERLIEEKLFANVVVRFRRSVETRRLAEAVVDDALVTKVFHGMSEISAYAAHDTPAAAGSSWPDPDATSGHLLSLADCLQAIEAEAKVAKARREKLEKAPKGTAVATGPTGKADERPRMMVNETDDQGSHSASRSSAKLV